METPMILWKWEFLDHSLQSDCWREYHLKEQEALESEFHEYVRTGYCLPVDLGHFVVSFDDWIHQEKDALRICCVRRCLRYPWMKSLQNVWLWENGRTGSEEWTRYSHEVCAELDAATLEQTPLAVAEFGSQPRLYYVNIKQMVQMNKSNMTRRRVRKMPGAEYVRECDRLAMAARMLSKSPVHGGGLTKSDTKHVCSGGSLCESCRKCREFNMRKIKRVMIGLRIVNQDDIPEKYLFTGTDRKSKMFRLKLCEFLAKYQTYQELQDVVFDTIQESVTKNKFECLLHTIRRNLNTEFATQIGHTTEIGEDISNLVTGMTESDWDSLKDFLPVNPSGLDEHGILQEGPSSLFLSLDEQLTVDLLKAQEA